MGTKTNKILSRVVNVCRGITHSLDKKPNQWFRKVLFIKLLNHFLLGQEKSKPWECLAGIHEICLFSIIYIYMHIYIYSISIRHRIYLYHECDGCNVAACICGMSSDDKAKICQQDFAKRSCSAPDINTACTYMWI